MKNILKKGKELVRHAIKEKNIYEIWDTTPEKLKEIAEDKFEVDVIQMEALNPVYKENRQLDYVVFKSSEKGVTDVRVMRLIRIKNIPADIRTKMNNQKAFADLLKEFGNGNSLFVKLDAYKPGEDMLFTYGVAKEGTDERSLIEETKDMFNALWAQLKSAYENIELAHLTRDEHWLFDENFHFDELSVIRGIPRRDSSKGMKTGANIYSNPPVAEDESEIFYKGMVANDAVQDENSSAFLLISMFQLIDYELIRKLLDKIHLTISKLASSLEQGISDSENVGLPIMMGLGLGDSVGTTEQNGTSLMNSTAITDGDTVSNSTSLGTAEQHGNSIGKTSSITVTTGDSVSNTFGDTNSVGARFAGIGGDYSINDSQTTGESNSNSVGSGMNSSKSNSTTISKQDQFSSGKTHSVSNTTGSGETHVFGSNSSQNQNSSIAAGTSVGMGNSVSKRAFDAAIQTSLDKAELNRTRLQSALSVGMFEGMTFLLTPNKRTKTKAESLYKHAFLADGTPFPVRIEQFDKEKEKKLLRYAKMLKRVEVEEKRELILEKNRFSTYLTIDEMTAINPVQTNLPGFTTSHERIPTSMRINGKMKKGAFIGYQVNAVINEESKIPYYLAKEHLSHMVISGNTGMGKTTCVKRISTELHNEIGANVIVFDWATDYRSTVDNIHKKEHFYFHSFDSLMRLKLNFIKPPKNVPNDEWASILAQIFCIAFGLGNRSNLIVAEMIQEIIQKEKNPTMKHLAEQIEAEFQWRTERAKGMMDFNEKSTLTSMRDRLQGWMGEKRDKDGKVILDRKNTNMYKSFCEEGDFVDIGDLLKGDFYRVIECAAIPKNERPFVINAISAAISYYKQYNRSYNQKPMYMILEEAHEIVHEATGNEALQVGETIFEGMNRFTRKFGLFFIYSCQNPEKLPAGIFKTSPILITFQVPSEESKQMIVSAWGRDPKRLDVELVNYLSRLEIGRAIVRRGNVINFVDSEPTLIQVVPIPLDEDYIDNSLFKKHYERVKKARR